MPEPGRVSGVHRYQPIPGPESPSVNSVSFSPRCLGDHENPDGDMATAVNAAIPDAGGSSVRRGSKNPKIGLF